MRQRIHLKRILKVLECLRHMFTVRIPWEVSLSDLVGVGGCGCPIYVKVYIIGTSTWPLWKMVPVPDPSEEAMNVRMILHSTEIGPFGVGFCIVADVYGVFIKWKFPADNIWTLDFTR